MAGEAHRARLRVLLRTARAESVDLDRLNTAFVHESAVREGRAERSNERLEFLGDAILGAVVAQWLYFHYPDANEGELAQRKASLVSDALLARTAERLGFGDLLVLGEGLARLPPARRRSTLSDAFEAVVAVLASEASPEIARDFVARAHLEPHAADVEVGDPKSTLQEWTQKRRGMTPLYRDRAEGPPHERLFHTSVWLEGERLAEGTGPSKKAAQRAAAAAALDALRVDHDDVDVRPLSIPVGLAHVPASVLRKAPPAKASRGATRA